MAGKRFRKIPVGTSSQSSEINPKKRYRIRIDGQWYEGSFSKQWFGWHFDGYGTSGMQLNLIDEVFEILSPDPKAGKRR